MRVCIDMSSFIYLCHRATNERTRVARAATAASLAHKSYFKVALLHLHAHIHNTKLVEVGHSRKYLAQNLEQTD